MKTDTEIQNSKLKIPNSKSKHLNRLKIAAVLFTIFGIALFVYLIATTDYKKIWEGILNVGFDGFAILSLIYLMRLTSRAAAWKLSVYAPYKLDLRDTLPAVVIGEAMSTMIPLGILISGTAKSVAVRNKIPLVVGLSSVATENLFYSLITGLFIVFGGFAFLRSFDLADGWRISIDVSIVLVLALIALGFVMVLRQWHFVSDICEKLYQKGWWKNLLENGRAQVKLFEDLIYGFYREYPRRFLPIVIFEILFHVFGILEVWFVLSRISTANLFTSFLLESISRVILTTFKLVPFVIGVDEAGAKFVTETLALGASVGVTLAIIRKGRSVIWTLLGVLLIVKRGLSIKEFTETRHEENETRI